MMCGYPMGVASLPTGKQSSCSISHLEFEMDRSCQEEDVVQLLSHVLLFATLWTTARQASPFFTNSQSLLKLMSIESVMPPNHLVLCCPLLLLSSILPSIRVFPNESALCIRCQSIGVSASTSVLPMKTQD